MQIDLFDNVFVVIYCLKLRLSVNNDFLSKPTDFVFYLF
ncbi:hypothetical protein BOVA208_2712 [Bacteroides ovatus]|nr:hypothetical protein BOVA208_2712 [Bacteroides ovatus]